MSLTQGSMGVIVDKDTPPSTLPSVDDFVEEREKVFGIRGESERTLRGMKLGLYAANGCSDFLRLLVSHGFPHIFLFHVS